MPKHIDEYEALLTDNPLFKERMIGIGVLKAEDALAWGVTGPILRACGVALDLRKTNPYWATRRTTSTRSSAEGGDCYDRYLVRVAELREASRSRSRRSSGCRAARSRPANRKVMPPPREELAHSMESVIHHFKLFTEGIRRRPARRTSRSSRRAASSASTSSATARESRSASTSARRRSPTCRLCR